MKYAIAAYKSDSADYCRGCLMASYSSAFRSIHTDDQNQALEFLTEILYQNLIREHGEDEYEFTFFSPDLDEWGDPQDNPYQEELKVAEQLAKAKLEKEKKAKEEAEAEKARLSQAYQIRMEKEQLRILQAKYSS